MKILFIYPGVVGTFWSFKHALRVVHRKAAFPPLGAPTFAAMLQVSWNKRLVDSSLIAESRSIPVPSILFVISISRCFALLGMTLWSFIRKLSKPSSKQNENNRSKGYGK